MIAIIGILSTIGIASFTGAQARGRDAARKSDLAQMKRALEMAKNDSRGASYYPDQGTMPTCGSPWPADGSYMKRVPCDPKTRQSYGYWVTGGSTGAITNYLMQANLENTSDPAIAASKGCAGCDPLPSPAYCVCSD